MKIVLAGMGASCASQCRNLGLHSETTTMACCPFAGLVRSGVLGVHLLLATDGHFH